MSVCVLNKELEISWVAEKARLVTLLRCERFNRLKEKMYLSYYNNKYVRLDCIQNYITYSILMLKTMAIPWMSNFTSCQPLHISYQLSVLTSFSSKVVHIIVYCDSAVVVIQLKFNLGKPKLLENISTFCGPACSQADQINPRKLAPNLNQSRKSFEIKG